MKPFTAVAISGGIDSLTAAFLLKQAGHRVVGIHFLTGYETQGYQGNEIKRKLSRIADQLGIPIETIDCAMDFKTRVVDYFVASYAQGRTPNPCLMCNPVIKFGTVLAFARQLGAERLATGHYARILRDDKGGVHLHCGVDTAKDQSYFLARLTRKQLLQAVFPLGAMTKAQTRSMARANGLRPAARQESQDVCFIHGQTYGDFLKHHGMPIRPGPIVGIKGNLLGEHKGLHLFTIGQRRGINCPAPQPYYVVGIDPARNRLTVGSKDDLLTDCCRVASINWIQNSPGTARRVRTRIRYRHTAAESTLVPCDAQTADVLFEKPQKALTPGQGAVFYDGDEVLGGGWIER